MRWQPELRVRKGQHVWSGANQYEALVSHRTGFLKPELVIADRPGEFWVPVCWICTKPVTDSSPGYQQDDGYWLHDAEDCVIEDLSIGVHNRESFERSS